jgi:hypothetical protein
MSIAGYPACHPLFRVLPSGDSFIILPPSCFLVKGFFNLIFDQNYLVFSSIPAES